MNFINTFIQNHPTHFVMVDGKRRNYLVGGKGSTVLLIFPGSGQDALSCYDFIDAFEKEMKVIAINYDHLSGLEEFYEYVDAIIDKEKTKALVIYGLSIGGFLVQHYVRHRQDRVSKIIISHAGTTRSKTIINKVAIPGKILRFFLPIIPISLFRRFLTNLAGRVQSGQNDVKSMYKKYSIEKNLERRIELFSKVGYGFLTRDYLESIYRLGVDMEKSEKRFTKTDLSDWKGKILIIRTDNDPMAQDDGMFKKYYPEAKVITLNKTGHLTPFVRFEEMVKKIHDFLD